MVGPVVLLFRLEAATMVLEDENWMLPLEFDRLCVPTVRLGLVVPGIGADVVVTEVLLRLEVEPPLLDDAALKLKREVLILESNS